MTTRLTHTSYILEFLDVGFDSDEISREMTQKADGLISQCSVKGVDDWDILFRAVYNNARQLLISKNKFGTYNSDKYKEITIVIPIPSLNVTPWGVKDEQYIYPIDNYDAIQNNFNSLNITYNEFTNRKQYILDCLRRAIDYCFRNGILIKGVKISADNMASE